MKSDDKDSEKNLRNSLILIHKLSTMTPEIIFNEIAGFGEKNADPALVKNINVISKRDMMHMD